MSTQKNVPLPSRQGVTATSGAVAAAPEVVPHQPENVPAPAASEAQSASPTGAGDHCPRCRASATGGSTTPYDPHLSIRRARDARVRQLAEPVWVVPCLRLGWGNCRNTRTQTTHPPKLAEMDCGQHDTLKENVA